LQLAKAAIAAGIQVLLEEYGIAADAIASIYLAGAFGNYINIDSARRIGLLQFDEQCIEAVGNTALLGAKLALCNMHSEEEFAAVLATVQHVVLADNSRFHEQFVRGTVFPDARCP
jgi:uncharacterized 2Fe-2S/4Fe-4S cluster protein (DUF4445 family)